MPFLGCLPISKLPPSKEEGISRESVWADSQTLLQGATRVCLRGVQARPL